jgi:hypothetical protein
MGSVERYFINVIPLKLLITILIRIERIVKDEEKNISEKKYQL